MSSLTSNISSQYISAANALKKSSRKRIVAYVESYDDVYFWRTVLSDFEDETRYFEVMLPTRESLSKGKKKAIMAMLAEGGGKNLIACVDADYDYLLQGCSPSSHTMLSCPYIFHTYVYAIENYQCYAPSLHNVCVMATLNDHIIFDFVSFAQTYSSIIFPLFVWNILLYRRNAFHDFTMTDFNRTIEIGHFTIHGTDAILNRLQHKVETKIREVRKQHQGLRNEYEKLVTELATLGVTPQNTYLYIQGHMLFDNIIGPVVSRICDTLRLERENEIRRKACHYTQQRNELSAYQHVQTDTSQMLKKNTGYTRSVPFKQLQAKIQSFLDGDPSPILPESRREDNKN